jgi:hypothetical protein
MEEGESKKKRETCAAREEFRWCSRLLAHDGQGEEEEEGMWKGE